MSRKRYNCWKPETLGDEIGGGRRKSYVTVIVRREYKDERKAKSDSGPGFRHRTEAEREDRKSNRSWEMMVKDKK